MIRYVFLSNSDISVNMILNHNIMPVITGDRKVFE